MAESLLRRRWRAQAVVPVAWLLVGLVIAAVAGVQVQRSIDQAAAADFSRGVDRLAQEVMRRFGLPVHGLGGARALFAANPQTSRSAFRAFVASRNLPVEFPGVRGFGFIERVPRGQVDAFVAAERADGAPQFALHRWSVEPRDDLHVVKLIEPASDNPGVAGLDVGSEAVRREALERAIDSGVPTITAPITLAQDTRHTPGLLLFMPAYQAGRPQVTPAQRRAALRGVLYAPIVYTDLLLGLADAVGVRADLRLVDGGAAAPADAVVFDSTRAPGASGEAATAAARHTALRPLALAGRTLTLEVRSTPVFDASYGSRTPALVFASIALASVLLAALLRQQATGRQRAEALAQGMTIELDRLAKVAQRTSNAVIITDRALRITWVNEAFCRLYGYSSAQALGQTPGALLGTDRTPPAVL